MPRRALASLRRRAPGADTGAPLDAAMCRRCCAVAAGYG